MTSYRKPFSKITFEQRKKLEKLLRERMPIRDIVKTLQMSRSTIYYERLRMGSIDIPYNAQVAQNCNRERGRAARFIEPYQRMDFSRKLSRVYKLIKASRETRSLS